MNWQSIDKNKPPVGALILVTYINGLKIPDIGFAKLMKNGRIYYSASYQELLESLDTCHSEDINSVEPDGEGNPLLWCLFEWPERISTGHFL